MSELDGLLKLAETQKREKAKIEGKLETLYEELGEEGFTSLDSVKIDLGVLNSKIERMKSTYNRKFKAFKKVNAKYL